MPETKNKPSIATAAALQGSKIASSSHARGTRSQAAEKRKKTEEIPVHLSIPTKGLKSREPAGIPILTLRAPDPTVGVAQADLSLKVIGCHKLGKGRLSHLSPPEGL